MSSSLLRSLRQVAVKPTFIRSLSLSSTVHSGSAETGFLGAPKSRFVFDLEVYRQKEPYNVFRMMRENGEIVEENRSVHESKIAKHSDAELLKMHETMVKLNEMDKIFYESQRQGRISFYMTSFGEEATHVGSASALEDGDVVFGQYREAGVLMYRGFTLEQFAHQCFSTALDVGKGRQMPVHYGSRRLNFQTISSPLGTQLPQAAGAAYALKRDGKKNVVICYFGEGAASEGDFHCALNMSATLSCPVIFFCRNNGYAISTPVKEQYKGDGIAARGVAYGIPTIRCDGNDVFAVHEATARARELALANNEPVLIEAMTYRGGHHSTSDDSTRYRSTDEIAQWAETTNPIVRLRKFMEKKGIWDSNKETELRKATRTAVLNAMNEAERAKKPAVSQLFTDVYDDIPTHLKKQQTDLLNHLQKYKDQYNLDEFEKEDHYVDPALQDRKDVPY